MRLRGRSRTLAASVMLSVAAHGALGYAFSLGPTRPTELAREPMTVEIFPFDALAPPPASQAIPGASSARSRPASKGEPKPSPIQVEEGPPDALPVADVQEEAPPQGPPDPAPELAPVAVSEPVAAPPSSAEGGPALATSDAARGGTEDAHRHADASSAASAGSPFGDVHGYLGDLQERVRRSQRYPELAIRLGLEGVVDVRVRVNLDGTFAGPPAVATSSGHALLDQEALRMVARAAPFPPLPADAVRPADLTVPVWFHLEE